MTRMAVKRVKVKPRVERKAPPAPPLSEASIVEAACLLIAESGVDGLTVRALSDRLGVSLGSTYHHVPSRQALLTLVANELFQRVETPDAATADWRGALRQLIVDMAGVFGGHPGMVVFHLSHPDGTNAAQLEGVTRAILQGAGFSAGSARAVMAALFYYLNGVLLDDPSGGYGVPRDRLDAAFLQGLDLILDGAQSELGLSPSCEASAVARS
jgi:AcrR family transcriptional regulator